MTTTTATPDTPVPSTTPSDGPHTAAAQAFIDQLRVMREQIPNFAFAPEKPIARKLIINANVPDALIETVSLSVANSTKLIIDGADEGKLRDLMAVAKAYKGVGDALDATTAATKHTVTDARHQAGTIALNVYALAKRLAKKPGNAELIPMVEQMQRDLGRKQPHPRKKAVPASTTPGQQAPTAPANPSHASMEPQEQTPPPTGR